LKLNELGEKRKSKSSLGDMRDEAEVGAGGAQLVVHVEVGRLPLFQAQRSKGER
jgi:hypothetical protein